MKKKLFTGILSLLVLTGMLTGCNAASPTPTNKDNSSGERITIAAAADLALAFKDIEVLYEQHTGNDAEITYSSSGTAREQIANGAPYDVYASANIKYVDDLIEQDRIIADTKQLYAIGRVGIATLIGSSLQVTDASNLLNPEFKKIAIADPSHAPYGVAAKEAFQSLGLWDELEDRMVYGKDIQDVLTQLKTGNVEAAFISLSVYNKDEVNFLLLDDSLHNPLKQAIAVVKGTEHEEASREFIEFVNGEQGRNIMKKYGFVLPGEI